MEARAHGPNRIEFQPTILFACSSYSSLPCLGRFSSAATCCFISQVSLVMCTVRRVPPDHLDELLRDIRVRLVRRMQRIKPQK